jgi:hypothetical protein
VAVVQYTFTHKQYTEQHNETEYAELKQNTLSSWLLLHPQIDYVNLLSLIVKLSSVQFAHSLVIVSESILKASLQYLPKQRMRM